MINGVAADYLNINDRAIHYGDGIFETVLCSNNSLYFWQQHYLRLKTSAEKQQFIDRWLTMMEMAHGGRERARKEFQEKGPPVFNPPEMGIKKIKIFYIRRLSAQ